MQKETHKISKTPKWGLERILAFRERRKKEKKEILNLNGMFSSNPLKGSLTIKEKDKLRILKVSDNALTHLVIRDCPLLEVITCLRNQEWDEKNDCWKPTLEKLEIINCPNVKEIYCTHNNLTTLDITGLNLHYFDYNDNPWTPEKQKEFDDWSINSKIKKCLPSEKKAIEAQKWLDKQFPKNTRKYIKKLDLRSKDLAGSLDLSEFVNLKKLHCDKNRLSSLIINSCSKLKIVSCSNNYLTNLDITNCHDLERLICEQNRRLALLDLSKCRKLKILNCSHNERLTNLNLRNCVELEELELEDINLISAALLKKIPYPDKMIVINLKNNDIRPTNIEIFRKFKNLGLLEIGTDEHYLKKEIRNKFWGSLRSWNRLVNLEKVDINATDIDDGLEHLVKNALIPVVREGNADNKRPFFSLDYCAIVCSSYGNKKFKCWAIEKELNDCNNNLEKWKKGHCAKVQIALKEWVDSCKSKENKSAKPKSTKITKSDKASQTEEGWNKVQIRLSNLEWENRELKWHAKALQESLLDYVEANVEITKNVMR